MCHLLRLRAIAPSDNLIMMGKLRLNGEMSLLATRQLVISDPKRHIHGRKRMVKTLIE